MAVTAQTTTITYTASGSATAFAYPFRILESADLEVYVNGVQTTTGFTITGVGVEAGGSVTFSTAPTVGTLVRLQRNIERNRTTDYVEGGALRAQTLDDDLDRIVMMLQDVEAGGTVVNNYASEIQVQSQTATASQTVFTTTDAYVLGSNTLEVSVNGALQVVGVDYTETSTNSFTFLSGLNAGDVVLTRILRIYPGVTTSSALVGWQRTATGSVARTVDAKIGEVISVKDFGAVGDGVTNDTAAVQAAINYAQQIKAWVFFPATTCAYMVSGLTIGQSGTNYTCHFFGGGYDPSCASAAGTGQFVGQSMIKLIAGSNTSLITVHPDAAQPMFKNITLNGNGVNQSSTSYCLYMADVAFDAARYRYAAWLEDVLVSGGRNGGLFIGSNRGAGHYRNVWVQYCGTATSDIAVNVRSYDQQFSNMQIGPNNGIGMYVGGATQVQIEGSVFFMNYIGMQVDEGTGTLQVSNTVFDQSTRYGLTSKRGISGGAYGARVLTNCAWQRNSYGATNTYSDILVYGDQRLVLVAPAFVGDFGEGWLPKYNIEFDNSIQTGRVRVIGQMLEATGGSTSGTAFTNQYSQLATTGDRTVYLGMPGGTGTLSVLTSDTERVRFTSSALSLVGAVLADPNYTTPVPTAGSTVTAAQGKTLVALLPAGALATLTVSLPPNPVDGQRCTITSSQAITALTITYQSPATFCFNASASLAAGQSITFAYTAGGTCWIRA